MLLIIIVVFEWLVCLSACLSVGWWLSAPFFTKQLYFTLLYVPLTTLLN